MTMQEPVKSEGGENLQLPLQDPVKVQVLEVAFPLEDQVSREGAMGQFKLPLKS